MNQRPVTEFDPRVHQHPAYWPQGGDPIVSIFAPGRRFIALRRLGDAVLATRHATYRTPEQFLEAFPDGTLPADGDPVGPADPTDQWRWEATPQFQTIVVTSDGTRSDHYADTYGDAHAPVFNHPHRDED